MPESDHRLRLLRRMALLCAVLMLATISLSAFMRLSQAGLGCDAWPACYGQALREAQQGSAAVAAARLLHRVVATLALILVITMALSSLATRPVLRREGWLSAALVFLALALAALGLVTPGARLPAVTLGNLLGGFVMLALCWRLAAPATEDSVAERAPLRGWAIAGLTLLTAQIALGSIVSGSYAALSCNSLADCNRVAQATGWDWQALNPWREPSLGSLAPFNPTGALAQWAHRIGALITLPVLALVGAAAWRRGHGQAGASVLALVAVQGSLGWLMVATGLPIALVLLHNLCAALLLAALARMV